MTVIVSSLSTNLKALMQQTQVNAAELSRKTGVPPQTLNRLLNAKTDDPRASTLQSIANYFNITIDELIGCSVKPHQIAGRVDSKQEGFIPFFSEAPEKYLIGDVQAQEWLSVDSRIDNQNAFAVVHHGDAMFPRLLDGNILIIDRNKAPKKESFVYVYLGNRKECCCRKWVQEAGEVYLIPINPGFTPIKLEESVDMILGVVVQMKSFL